MSLSLELIDYVVINTQNGVTDTLSPQPLDNCHTIVIFNSDVAKAALVGIVPTATALTATTAATVPAGGSLTLRIGSHGYRPCGSLEVGNRRLRVEGIGGTPTLSIQYVNSTVPTAP